MNSVYIIGDTHTVNAVRICGIEGFTADAESSHSVLRDVLAKEDALVILVTRDCAAGLQEEIRRINLDPAHRVIIEIPGLEDNRGFGRSLTSYITEALGVAL